MSLIGNPLVSTNYQTDTFNGDGTTVAFTLSQAPASPASIAVYISGLYQVPVSAYSITGTTLTFTGAPPTGTGNILVLHLGVRSSTLVPVNQSITPAMLNNANVIFWSMANTNVGIGNTAPRAPLTIGTASGTFTNPLFQAAGSANSWIQLNAQNLNNGNNASTDLVLARSDGTDTSGFIDMGINSNTYAQAGYSIMTPNSGYLFTNGGDLVIGTQTAHNVLFHTGNTTANSERMRITTGGVTVNGAITLSDNTQFSSAASLGTRNILINGAFDIWQRGTSWTSTFNYTADRWQGTRYASANFNVSRQASGLTGFDYCIRAQRPSGDTGTTAYFINQPIESVTSRKYAGQTLTLSAWIRVGSNFSGNTVKMTIGYHTNSGLADDGMFYSNFKNASTVVLETTCSANTTWRRFTYTVPGFPTNLQQLGVSFYVDSSSGTAGSNDFFEVTGAQLEVGTSATPFEYRPYAEELALCQRYCWAGTTAIYGYFAFSGNIPMGTWTSFPVTMRNSPTVTFGTPTTTSLTNSEAAGYISTSGFVYYVNITATGTIARSNPTLATAEL